MAWWAAPAASSASAELVRLLSEAGKPAIDEMAATVCGSAFARLDMELVRWVLEFNEALVELPDLL